MLKVGSRRTFEPREEETTKHAAPPWLYRRIGSRRPPTRDTARPAELKCDSDLGRGPTAPSASGNNLADGCPGDSPKLRGRTAATTCSPRAGCRARGAGAPRRRNPRAILGDVP